MGKKKSKKKSKVVSRTPRKEKYTSERMMAHVERIREQAARLSGLARSMEDAKIKHIIVDGHAMLMRGLNQVENFADNASRAVREAKNAKSD